MPTQLIKRSSPKNHHLGKRKSHKKVQSFCSTEMSGMGPRTDLVLFLAKKKKKKRKKVWHLLPFKRNHSSCFSMGQKTLAHQAAHYLYQLNTIYIIMCNLHNKWYVGSSTDLKAHWRNHKSNAKLMKATKCGVSGHVTKCTHPEDPNLAILLSWPSKQ